MRTLILTFLLLGASFVQAGEPTLVYLIRHAEKVDASKDPDLSPRGYERAKELALFFEKVHIHAMFASQYQRTQKTLAPLSAAKKMEPVIVDAAHPEVLVSQVEALPGKSVVIAGHSNTIPDLIKRFGGPAITIADTEYRNIFLLVLHGKRPRSSNSNRFAEE